MKNKKQHGGARAGAGRKKLKDPNVQIYFRVPANKRERYKQLIKAFIKRNKL